MKHTLISLYSKNHIIRHIEKYILYIRIHEEQQKAIEKAVTKVRAEEKAERDRLQSENEMLRAENEELKKNMLWYRSQTIIQNPDVRYEKPHRDFVLYYKITSPAVF